MRDKPPDGSNPPVQPRFAHGRKPLPATQGQRLFARGVQALGGKGASQTLRVARGQFGPNLKSGVAKAIRSAAHISRSGRGAGVRAAGKHAQRVIVKARIVPLRGAAPAKALRQHVAYIEREGVDRTGGPGRMFGAEGELDPEQIDAFTERGLDGRHQFRFIVSPEHGGALDLERYTRDLVRRMEGDLGSRLDYVACAHYDTDQPHVHILMNGRDERGGDLVISRDYIGNGLRQRAMELATNELGYRTDQQVLRSLAREVQAERYTALDRRLQTLQERNPNGVIDLHATPTAPRAAVQRRLYLARLAHLGELGLAEPVARRVWRLEPDAIERLRGHTQHRAIQQQVERHLTARDRGMPLEVVDKAKLTNPITGQVLGRGLANELSGTPYLVVAGIDGKIYYAALSAHSERHEPVRRGDIVSLSREMSRSSGQADRNIAAFAARFDGIYDANLHLRDIGEAKLPYGATPERFVEAHVRRLDALASRGLVARESEGRYRVPPDLVAQLDTEPVLARDAAFVKIERHTGESLRRQAGARAFTWLDEQLIAGLPQQLRQALQRGRFQDEILDAADRRVRRLVQLGLASFEGEGVRLDPQLRPKLVQLERDTQVARLGEQYGTYVDLETVRQFTGRVAAIETLSGRPHAVVASGAHFTLVPAERGLSQTVGKEVVLSLASDDPSRVRYRVLDALDLSPTLSFGR